MNQHFPIHNTQSQIVLLPSPPYSLSHQYLPPNLMPQLLMQGPPNFIVSNPINNIIPQRIHHTHNMTNSLDLRRLISLNYIQKPVLNRNQQQFIPKSGYFPSLGNNGSNQTIGSSRIPAFPFSSNLSLQNNIYELKSVGLPQRNVSSKPSPKKNYEVYTSESRQPYPIKESNDSSFKVKKNGVQNGEEDLQKGLTREQNLEKAILRYFEEYQIEIPIQNKEKIDQREKITSIEALEIEDLFKKINQKNGSLDKKLQKEVNGSLNKIVQKEEPFHKNHQINGSLNKISQKEESLQKNQKEESISNIVENPLPLIQKIVPKEQPPNQKDKPSIKKKEQLTIQNIVQNEQPPILKIPQKTQPIQNVVQNQFQKIPENENLNIKLDFPLVTQKEKGEENKDKIPLNKIHFMTDFHADKIEKDKDPAKNISEINRGLLLSDKLRKLKTQASKKICEDYLQMPELPYFKEFTDAYKSAKKLGRNFIDKEFYPDQRSLIERKNSVRAEKWSDFIWCRPNEFNKGDYFIFNSDNSNESPELISVRGKSLLAENLANQTIEVDDIVQGSLGDCYFLSSLSSLAENPVRIRNLFVSKKINENCGIYCVKICHEGVWRAVFVDDYFPCYSKSQGPCFSKSKKGENELWVLILEKAWAKLYCNYERIEAGLTREVLRDLTGAPTKVVWTDEPQLWEEILKGESKDYIMTAGAIDESAMSKVKMNKGMVSGHAYSLISAHTIKKIKVLKLRNPWGKGEWKGPWCDEDPIWNSITKKEKDEVGYNVKDDGTFFMGLDYFMKIYSDVQICMVEDCYDYVSISLKTQKKKGVYLEVEVKTDGEYFFSILQPTMRKMNNKDYTESHTHIVLAQRNNEELVFVNAKQKTHREVFVQNQIKKGKYVVYCKVDWENAKEGSFVFSSYGEDAVAFKVIQKEPNFFERVYMNKAMNSVKKKTYNPLNAEKAVEFFPDEGYGYFFVDNREKKSLSSGIRMKKYDGLALKKKYGKMEKGKIFELVTKGNSQKILIFRVELGGYSVDYDEDIEF